MEQQLLGHFSLDGSPLPNRLCRPTQIGSALRLDAAIVHEQGSLTVAISGRPRLGDEPFDAATIGSRFLAAFRARGRQCVEQLRGSFALAVIDRETREALLAIDRIGIETLSWTLDGATLSFGTSANAVARARSRGVELNSQALFDFMLGHMIAAPDTVYTGVAKLLAGHVLVARRGQASSERYWNPPFEHAPPAQVGELRAQVLPTIGRAIERCEPDERTGTFLSGGLDSSTVTGLFARSRNGATNAFSVAFGVDEYNELSYAKAAVREFGCTHHVYEVVPEDVVESIPRVAAAYDEPFGNSSAVPTFCCARLAQQRGMTHLLAGDGGDEIFGGNSRYVRHKVFELYGKAPRWLRSWIAEPLAARLNPETAPLPLRKLSSYVRQARVPLPERFESWNLIYREGATAVFDAGFLAAVDPAYPLRTMRELWESCPSKDLLDRMLWYDWKLTLADNDLRKVSRMCELAGIRVSYPMLDEEVVGLSIRVPSAAKIAGAELRTFFKSAVRGFLPEEIIRKEKHGFGLPFGLWLKTHRPLQELVYGSLESLRARRVINSVFIDRVIDEHRSGHASYYGYAIWDMVMIEQWWRHANAPPVALGRAK